MSGLVPVASTVIRNQRQPAFSSSRNTSLVHADRAATWVGEK